MDTNYKGVKRQNHYPLWHGNLRALAVDSLLRKSLHWQVNCAHGCIFQDWFETGKEIPYRMLQVNINGIMFLVTKMFDYRLMYNMNSYKAYRQTYAIWNERRGFYKEGAD